MDVELTKAALRAAESIYGTVGLVAWTPLTSDNTATSDNRTTVARMLLLTDAGGQSVIVKSSPEIARERAALELAASAKVDGVPRLLAVLDDPPLILIEDLGSGDVVGAPDAVYP